MRLEDLAPAGVAFVVTAVVLGLGADIVTDMRDGGCANATAPIGNADYCGYDIYNYSVKGIGEVASWLPTIALVIAAAVVIGVVVTYFSFRR